MKKILVRRKHLNEDEVPQQQPVLNNTNQQQAAPQQPANNAQALPQTQQQPQTQQSAQQPNQPQQTEQNNNQQPENGIDLNSAVANVNKFIGTLYQTIQNTVKDNLVKSCPEVDAMSKDQNSPYKDAVKKMNDAFLNFTKNPVKIDDPKNVADSITAFTTFVSALSEFNSNLTAASQNQSADNNQTQPQQGNVNASYDTSLFGKMLAEKIQIAKHERAILNF